MQRGSMQSKLYVGNLPIDITTDELKTIFSLAGTVVEVSVTPSTDTRRKKSNATITFSSRAGTLKAIHMFRYVKYRNRTLKLAEERPTRTASADETPGGGRSIIPLVGLPGGLTGDSTTDAPPPRLYGDGTIDAPPPDIKKKKKTPLT